MWLSWLPTISAAAASQLLAWHRMALHFMLCIVLYSSIVLLLSILQHFDF